MHARRALPVTRAPLPVTIGVTPRLVHVIIAGHIGAIAFLASILAGAPDPAAVLVATGATLAAYAVSRAVAVRA